LQSKISEILEFDKILSKLKKYSETKMGQELIGGLSPIYDIDEIKHLQEETSEATSLLTMAIEPTFSSIYDIRFSLDKAQKGSILSPKELLDISDTLRGFRSIKKQINKKDNRFNFNIVDMLNSRILLYDNLENKINSCIEGENEIADKASKELYNIRRNLKTKSEAVKDKLSDIINSPKFIRVLQEPIVTMRNNRYVVPVKQEYKTDFAGIVHDQSSSGATFFVEPMSVVRLNNEIRELRSKEKYEIEKILNELTTMVAKVAAGIQKSLKAVAQLDFIFAKAKMSIDYEGTQPFLNTNGYVNIKQGRHPLLKGDVVPIDIIFGKDYSSLVITGPNTGGKTVTLKTVGLLTLMAQAGLHVPAKWGTELAVFESVYADIGDEQSIEQNLSTFSSHMINIISILDDLKLNSLVLLDELGAGTDPVEGAALAMAILEYLHKKNIRVVATTHYSELKAFAYTNKGFKNASVEFDVETLSPTYRLILGLPGKSNAFEIATRLGLSKDIIQNAKKFMKTDDKKAEDFIRDIHKDINITRAQRAEAEKTKNEIENIKEQYLAKIKDLKNEEDKILKKAQKRSLDIIEKAIKESEEIIKEIEELKNLEAKEKNRTIDESRKKLRTIRSDIVESLAEPILKHGTKEDNKGIKIGDKVLIRGIDQTGYVVEKFEDDKVMVQIGVIKMTVPVSATKNIDKETENEALAANIGKLSIEKANNIATELDLRGKTLQETFDEVDKYIDDAYIAGLPQVTLIHGKGTGVLREGIQKFLKDNHLINSYRLGKFNEGGTGVTIVELKR